MKTGKPKNPRQAIIFYYIGMLVLLLAVNAFLMPGLLEGAVRPVTYNQFVSDLEAGKIIAVEEDANQGTITYEAVDDKGNKAIFETAWVDDPDRVQRLLDATGPDGKAVEFSGVEPPHTSPLMRILLSFVLPLVLMVAIGQILGRFLMKRLGGPGAMSFGKSSAKVYVQAQTGKTFADVAGQDEAKEALEEIVDFLHNPKKYNSIGAKLPKGALLVGPPGTGKTLLAQAVAGEAGVPFFSIAGSEFVEMFVGMGAARVRDLFKQAAEKAPCIVFIDEIDTIGKSRDNAAGVSGGNDEREQTLNQLLTEMDGFDGSKGVIILAATNRPETLDKALLRPGRFDRRIPVELPDLEGRAAILKVHAKKVLVDENVDFMAIARATSGASGAELANMINEAALRAVKHNRRIVNQEDLMEAVETVIAGYQRKNKVLSPKEKRIVAYHEIGHALVAAKQTESAPVAKITIVPRTSGALGYTLQVPEQETNLMSREEVLNKIATLTGGRAAEELIFGSYTTGASNDIEQATRLARNMVTRLGMSDQFDMMALSVVNNQYLGGDSSLVCSEGTAAKVDDEVLGIIKSAHAKARKILEENLDKLHELSAFLMERESITGEEFMEILNRPASEEGTQASEEEKEKPESNQ
ncbi:MAG: ATP-dependent zinc metalloprotease FtsH [Candidatus Fournierella pullistercoris]|uniref:ATP-dependent zinc metalloprotease FtsH n=1 Tax=Candidatus Allofournierella pullistercoris TaxID=2838597 RepID=A0A948T132_9FIRM|nr:ATP-dependent zinc metalloprotease FtsH [Candidatus Fournierella pullistercoris]